MHAELRSPGKNEKSLYRLKKLDMTPNVFQSKSERSRILDNHAYVDALKLFVSEGVPNTKRGGRSEKVATIFTWEGTQ